jgi:type III secretory pathway component EscU
MGGPERGREESAGNEELVREVRQLRDEVQVRQLRDEVRDITRQLQRIGDALEDD